MTFLDPKAPNRDAVEQLLAAVTAWARERGDVKAVALAGSSARGTAVRSSDVDIVILTTDPSHYVETDEWASVIGIGSSIARKSWGALMECRGFTKDGLEVEFGIAEPSWANTDPPDPGTMRVVRDGMRVVYDPLGLLAKLMR